MLPGVGDVQQADQPKTDEGHVPHIWVLILDTGQELEQHKKAGSSHTDMYVHVLAALESKHIILSVLEYKSSRVMHMFVSLVRTCTYTCTFGVRTAVWHCMSPEYKTRLQIGSVNTINLVGNPFNLVRTGPNFEWSL